MRSLTFVVLNCVMVAFADPEVAAQKSLEVEALANEKILQKRDVSLALGLGYGSSYPSYGYGYGVLGGLSPGLGGLSPGLGSYGTYSTAVVLPVVQPIYPPVANYRYGYGYSGGVYSSFAR